MWRKITYLPTSLTTLSLFQIHLTQWTIPGGEWRMSTRLGLSGQYNMENLTEDHSWCHVWGMTLIALYQISKQQAYCSSYKRLNLELSYCTCSCPEKHTSTWGRGAIHLLFFLLYLYFNCPIQQTVIVSIQSPS